MIYRKFLLIIICFYLFSCSDQLNNKENEIRKFCSSISVGDLRDHISTKMKNIGEDRYRIERDEFIIIGITGNAPFPKKLCRVDFINGKISESHFYASM